MTEALARIIGQLDALSCRERAELAHVLPRSLETVEEGAEEAWDRELERRKVRIRSGEATGTPAEEVFAQGRRS